MVKDACTVQYIDHVGVVVRDLEAALKFFQEVFRIPPWEITELPEQGVLATLLPVGQTRLELLQPLSPIARWAVSWNAGARGYTTWPYTWTTSPKTLNFKTLEGWS